MEDGEMQREEGELGNDQGENKSDISKKASQIVNVPVETNEKIKETKKKSTEDEDTQNGEQKKSKDEKKKKKKHKKDGKSNARKSSIDSQKKHKKSIEKKKGKKERSKSRSKKERSRSRSQKQRDNHRKRSRSEKKSSRRDASDRNKQVDEKKHNSHSEKQKHDSKHSSKKDQQSEQNSHVKRLQLQQKQGQQKEDGNEEEEEVDSIQLEIMQDEDDAERRKLEERRRLRELIMKSYASQKTADKQSTSAQAAGNVTSREQSVDRAQENNGTDEVIEKFDKNGDENDDEEDDDDDQNNNENDNNDDDDDEDDDEDGSHSQNQNSKNTKRQAKKSHDETQIQKRLMDEKRQKMLKMLEAQRDHIRESGDRENKDGDGTASRDQQRSGEGHENNHDEHSEAAEQVEDFDMFDMEAVEKANERDKKRGLDGTSSNANDGAAGVHVYDDTENDDAEGYLKIRTGELLNERYKIVQRLGKGVFANVVKVVDLSEQLQNKNVVEGESQAPAPPKKAKELAVKILRSDEIMLRAGQREKQILEQLNQSDRADKRHIVRLLGSFEHKKHLCLAFELLEMNLRDAIKEYGKGKGLGLDYVRSFAQQIFKALYHMRKHRIIHADIKPDNILISQGKYYTKTVKVCDFGTAFPVEENTLVEYLVSRYYRAPEIILGYAYDTAIDVWSVACTLYELCTGRFLFEGRNNNQMLKAIQQRKGRFNSKMLRKGVFVPKYFDKDFNFLSQEVDPVTQQVYVKSMRFGEQAAQTIEAQLLTQARAVNNGATPSQEEWKKLQHFREFLERGTALDPKSRLTPEEALSHPFITQQWKN